MRVPGRGRSLVREHVLPEADIWIPPGHMTGVRLDGPNCYYCARPLAQVAKDGCGSQERGFDQERVNALCEVYERARRER